MRNNINLSSPGASYVSVGDVVDDSQVFMVPSESHGDLLGYGKLIENIRLYCGKFLEDMFDDSLLFAV